MATAKQRFGSISAPIRCLPRDVLLDIFTLCRPSRGSGLHIRGYPWTLGHICHWWRDIVHSSPTIWSVIMLCPPYNSEILETHLQRSGNVPLSVYFLIRRYGENIHKSTALDRVMGVSHRWSKLELHGPLYVGLPCFFPQLRTLNIGSTCSSHTVPVFNAPLLEMVRWDYKLPLQSVPNHITHLALSSRPIEALPLLSSFPNLVELHFTSNYPSQEAPSSVITHPTIRCLFVSDISMLPFLALPALEHFQYKDRTENNSVVSAFLSRSRCTLKTLVSTMLYGDSFLDLLGSQPSLRRLSVALIGDYHNAICQELSFPDFLPNLEHLTIAYLRKEFCVKAVKMIRARWYAPMRRIRTFVIINTEPRNVAMDGMDAMINEGLDFKVVEGPYGKEVWLDPLIMETEDIF
ncbi:hypothetical protein DFS33DRAFT_1345728 [Desarmillaria ectypa]|nr:hypothetical protein DFS33DRAFT_1345728 [Desarmillaria ectypa]